jgi:hypothetical protein
MRAKRKNVRELTSNFEQNEGAQMSSELESDRAMVVMELWWRFRVGVTGADKKNLGTSRSVTLRARFQFGTRGAESTTNRRERDDQRI